MKSFYQKINGQGARGVFSTRREKRHLQALTEFEAIESFLKTTPKSIISKLQVREFYKDSSSAIATSRQTFFSIVKENGRTDDESHGDI